MATTKRKTSKSTRNTSTNSQFPWGWIAAVALLVVLIGTNLTGVNTVRGDLAQVQAQLTAQSVVTATLAPATEVPVATEVVVTEVPKATVIPTEPSVLPTPQISAKDAHDQHLLALDPTYRSSGWENWLLAAGIEFDASRVESRQPVEEVIQGHVTVTSLVIRATGMVINWPACVTTDHPEQVKLSADTRQHQPDLRNASVMYTNATLNGQGTVYADCSDWGQLDPTK